MGVTQRDRATRATPAAPEEGLVGAQIRELRRAKQMTLAELAGRIERSIGYLSQIERDLSAVSITDLQRIADALDVQISWFFQGQAAAPEAERGFIVRRDNRRSLRFTGTGVQEEFLSPDLSGRIEMIVTTFGPGSRTGDEDRVRKGEEAGLVLSGRLEISVEGRRFMLETGDSFVFRKPGSHRCHNPGNVDTMVVWVYSPPAY